MWKFVASGCFQQLQNRLQWPAGPSFIRLRLGLPACVRPLPGRTQTDAKENGIRYPPFDAGLPRQGVSAVSGPQLAVIRQEGQPMRNIVTRGRATLQKLLILLNDEVCLHTGQPDPDLTSESSLS